MPYRLATAQYKYPHGTHFEEARGGACREFPLAPRRDILTGHRPWSRQKDSNPRPAAYKAAALPTEL